MGDGASATVHRRRTVTLPTGKTIEIEAIGLRDYAQVREQACADYKRNLLKTTKDNLDLFPEQERADLMRKALDKAELITPDDLPEKTVLDPATQKPTKVSYADWWMGMTVPGVVYAAWLSIRRCPGQSNMTLADVEAIFENQLEALHETGEAIADLSKPQLGNSDPAAAKAGTSQTV